MIESKQLDLLASERAKDEAIATVEKGAPEGWLDEARDLIKSLALRHLYICSDDLWAAGLSDPPEPRALGAAMRNARYAGLIEPTGHYVNSIQVSRHHAPVRIWRSKLLMTTGHVPFVESELLSRGPKT